ncbi:MAG: class I SAM-dependent methyltransferase [Rhodospirillales bacterium]|nr:class I SAM-dependent methyltransferase [Rhodospirillales bacterium]
MADKGANVSAWGLSGVLDFFAERRGSTAEVYPSEWLFLKDRLKEGVSVLDVGCAQGGFAAVIGEHVDDFRYVGADVSPEMIARARRRFPRHAFVEVREGDFSALGDGRFDLVLVLGILHLHETWRETLKAAWARTEGALIFDLREWERATIEDKARAYMTMNFNAQDDSHRAARLPYVLLNCADALRAVREICAGARRIRHHGYLHAPSRTAVVPTEEVMMNTWCAER